MLATEEVSSQLRESFDRQFLIDDVTMEVLADIHESNWRGLLLSLTNLLVGLSPSTSIVPEKAGTRKRAFAIQRQTVLVNRRTDKYRLYLPSTAEQAIDFVLARGMLGHHPFEGGWFVGGIVVNVHIWKLFPAFQYPIDKLLKHLPFSFAVEGPEFVVLGFSTFIGHVSKQILQPIAACPWIAFQIKEHISWVRLRQQPESPSLMSLNSYSGLPVWRPLSLILAWR